MNSTEFILYVENLNGKAGISAGSDLLLASTSSKIQVIKDGKCRRNGQIINHKTVIEQNLNRLLMNFFKKFKPSVKE